MRIAVIAPFTGPELSAAFSFATPDGALPPGYTHAPAHLVALVAALVERGHQVATLSTDYTTPIQALEPFRRFRGPRLQAYFCPQRPHGRRWHAGMPGRALDFFRYERRCLARAIEDFDPDVIHAHWTYEFAWAALDSGRPTLATAHDSPASVLRFMPDSYRLARYLMARRVLPRCTHLSAVSPDLASDLRRWSPGPIAVVPNPMPSQTLQGPGCAAEAVGSHTLVMVLNGWNRLKNGATALQAFRLARQEHPHLRLVCFGAGFEADGAAARWAAARGCDAQVEFRGPRPHAEILEQMRHGLALLHPARWEACCMAIAEAMSVGLPVIAGRHTGGVAWQLDDGRCGLLVDVNDARALARAVAQAGRDARHWAQMSQAARARARVLFALDDVTDRYLALYAQAMGAPPQRAAPHATRPVATA